MSQAWAVLIFELGLSWAENPVAPLSHFSLFPELSLNFNTQILGACLSPYLCALAVISPLSFFCPGLLCFHLDTGVSLPVSWWSDKSSTWITPKHLPGTSCETLWTLPIHCSIPQHT